MFAPRRVVYRKIILALVFVVVTGLMWLFYLLSNQLFRIRQIEVAGEGISVVIDETRFFSQNLIFFPTESLRRELLSQYPLLEDILIKKRLPGALIIIPLARQPAARLRTSSGEFILDKTGMTLGTASSEQLPLLIFEKREQEEIRLSLKFIVSLKDLKVDEMSKLDSQSLRAKVDNLDIFLPQNETIIVKADTLQQLLAGFRIKGTLPTVIDLRFEKPVVRF